MVTTGARETKPKLLAAKLQGDALRSNSTVFSPTFNRSYPKLNALPERLGVAVPNGTGQAHPFDCDGPIPIVWRSVDNVGFAGN